MHPRIRVVDLFAGCGGLTIGVAEAARALGLGIDVRLAVDFDADAASVYRANLPEAVVQEVGVEILFDGAVGAPPTAAENRIKRKVGRSAIVAGPPAAKPSDHQGEERSLCAG